MDEGDGWTRVRNTNGDEGYVPTNYLEQLSPEEAQYFPTHISKYW